ncbi:sphingomyelin phosphodiesterase 3-like [Platysternon megacephalum]|uniref:Sphingomyelin phosphodiesterase 3-like n=1 Tax=Platysternon megacephalum TaxID=55544 RepID=A0A4D9DUV4_9SAUR|nr:sphingomyelin phosphodiesterase 3-like [Platysternon megacephalum]
MLLPQPSPKDPQQILLRKSEFYPARVKCSVWRNPEEFDEKSGTPLGIQTGGKLFSFLGRDIRLQLDDT